MFLAATLLLPCCSARRGSRWPTTRQRRLPPQPASSVDLSWIHAFLPQRKPWKSMADDVASAAELAAQQPLMLAGVLPADRPEAEQLVGDIQVTLDRCVKWVEARAGRVSSVLPSLACGRHPSHAGQVQRRLSLIEARRLSSG